MTFEINMLKGTYFQGVETKRLQHGVNLMSTCTASPSNPSLSTWYNREATGGYGRLSPVCILTEYHVVPVHRVMCKYTSVGMDMYACDDHTIVSFQLQQHSSDHDI